MYALSDVENVVRRRVARKVRRHVRRSDRIQRRVLQTCQKAGGRMDKAVFELKKNVCKSVEQFNQRCESVCEKKEISKESQRITVSMVSDCQEVIEELQRV